MSAAQFPLPDVHSSESWCSRLEVKQSRAALASSHDSTRTAAAPMRELMIREHESASGAGNSFRIVILIRSAHSKTFSWRCNNHSFLSFWTMVIVIPPGPQRI